MAAGEAFSPGQVEQIDRAVHVAREETGLPFSVVVADFVAAGVGPVAQSARVLHASLRDAESAVLMAVDPVAREVVVVTGPEAGRWVDDRACGLAVMAMTSRFATGDLAAGVLDGVRALTEHARHAPSLHTDEP